MQRQLRGRWGVGMLLGLWFATAGLAADPRPAAEELQRQAQRCRAILETNLIDFYLPACLDRTHGGYLEFLDNNQFVAKGEKFLVLQARQLWFFSTLARAGIRKEAALAAARHGFDFLEKHFRDREHGGYFAKVSDAGKVIDPRKHAYLNSFALYGLVAYYRASGDAAALQAAQELFRTLEERAYDRAHQGYGEFFEANWQPITDPKIGGYIGASGTKTFNTHLHLLESFTDLFRVWPDPLVARRLAELMQINTLTLRHPRFFCNIDGWYPDWTMERSAKNNQASYGHDVECAWLVLDAGRVLRIAPAVLRSWAEGLCAYSLKHGYDTVNGGFFYTGPPGEPARDRRKEWWVQAEALVAMLELYRLTGNPEYYKVFAQTLDFVEKHQAAKEGSWWASLTPEGKPIGTQRSSPWQGGYHNGRSMLLCEALLKELAHQPPRTP